MDKESKKNKWLTYGIPLVCVMALGGGIYFSSRPAQEEKVAIETKEKKEPIQEKNPSKRIIGRLDKPTKKNKTVLDKIKDDKHRTISEPLLEQLRNPFYQTLDKGKLKQELMAFDDKLERISSKERENDTLKNKVIPLNLTNSKIDLVEKEKGNEHVTLVEKEKPTEPITNPETPTNPEKPVDPDVPVIPIDPNPPIIRVDYSQLEQELNQAMSVNQSEYLSSSIEPFIHERLVSLQLLNGKTATQKEVDAQIVQLKASMSGLVKKGDKTTLNELLKQLSSLNRDLYTEDSLKALDSRLKDADSLLSDDEVTQEMINDLVASLNQSKDNLKEIERATTSLSVLQQLVEEFKQLELGGYTTESVERFNQAMKIAEKLASKEIVSESDVQDSITQLALVKEGLTSKEEEQPIVEPEQSEKELNIVTENEWQENIVEPNTVEADNNPLNLDQTEVDKRPETILDTKEETEKEEGNHEIESNILPEKEIISEESMMEENPITPTETTTYEETVPTSSVDNSTANQQKLVSPDTLNQVEA